MHFQLPINLPAFPEKIRYTDRMLLIGSCFTEHIGDYLAQLKFPVLCNPHGILFDPLSVGSSLVSYTRPFSIENYPLVYFQELYHSWQHHSRFSQLRAEDALELIRTSHVKAQEQLRKAKWLVITLGSSFSYQLSALASEAGMGARGLPVANCHRAPAQWFQKVLLTAEDILNHLRASIQEVRQYNPELQLLLTISPVRHIRDGVIENNRSKARLIEAVHQLVAEGPRIYYFPAYELVIDVLRDYRFYDLDLVHPNFSATQYVLQQFTEHCFSADTRLLMEQVQELVTARKHRPLQPQTQAHRQFLQQQYQKATVLQQAHSFLDLKEELVYFQSLG
ncbi:MAG: GSCFA domain-containing protein [Chitinophagaceae bacterium]